MIDLILEEILLFIIVCVGCMVLREFVLSKDGTLRKILIAYFAVEVFIFWLTGLFLYASYFKLINIPIELLRYFLLLPKAAVKVWLFLYLKKNRIIKKNM